MNIDNHILIESLDENFFTEISLDENSNQILMVFDKDFNLIDAMHAPKQADKS